MTAADEIFESALIWLRDHYGEVRFWVERDIVWTVQQHLAERIAQERLPYRVFNDYPMLPGTNRALTADLVLVQEPVSLPRPTTPTGKWGASIAATLAVEFKYEPSHARWGEDIWPTKGQVVEWGEVTKDVGRVQEFVVQGRAAVACAVLIDEGRAFRHRPPISPATWLDWPNGVSVHRVRIG